MKTKPNMGGHMKHSLLKKILIIWLFATTQYVLAEKVITYPSSGPSGSGVILTLNDDDSFKELRSSSTIDIPKNLPPAFYRSNVMLAEEMAINEIAFWFSRYVNKNDCQRSNSDSFSRENIFSSSGSGQQNSLSQTQSYGRSAVCKYSNEVGLNLAGVQKLSEEKFTRDGSDWVTVVVGISTKTINNARKSRNFINNSNSYKPKALPANSIGDYKWTNPGAF